MYIFANIYFVYRFNNTPIATPPIKTNKVLRTSAKLNNNNNNDSRIKIDSPFPRKRSTRTCNGNSIKKQKLNNKESSTNEEISKFVNNNYENEQLPRDPWLISPTKSIKSVENKIGVVLRSSGRIPKSWKCNNPKENSTPLKSTTISKIKTPLTEPMTRKLRSHKIRNSKKLKGITSRSSWSVGMVTRSHRRSVKC